MFTAKQLQFNKTLLSSGKPVTPIFAHLDFFFKKKKKKRIINSLRGQ